MSGFRSFGSPYTITLIAGVLFAVICQIVATNCGLGLTYDSYLFLDGAEYFRGNISGTLFDQPVFQSKPPMFSLLLTVVPVFMLKWLFLIFLVLTLLVIGKIIDQLLYSNRWKSFTFLAIAGFTPLLMTHVYLWTEPLFLLLLFMSIYVLLNIKQFKPNIGVLLLAILGILMILTRHAGLFIIAGICLAMAFDSEIGWQKALIFLLVTGLAFAIWNFGLMGEGIAGRMHTLKAPVLKGNLARLRNIEIYLDSASTWLLPSLVSRWLRIVLFTVLIVALVLLAKSAKVLPRPQLQTLLIIGLTYYVLMHVSFLIDASSADRYLVPVFPLFTISAFIILEKTVQHKHRWLVYLVIIWLFYPLGRSVKNAIFWREKICQEISLSLNEGFIDYSYSKEDQ